MNRRAILAASAALMTIGWAAGAGATEPCDDFGECKVLIEINSTDGDIGFHFLMDGDDLNSASIKDPRGKRIFKDKAKGALKEQKLTETFVESAEPLCWPDPEADPDDEIVTLEEFLDRWTPGTYKFRGKGDGGEKSRGETELTYDLPAAPADLEYDDATGVVSWSAGDDLGECATSEELDDLVADGVLPAHPEDVPVAAWEVVFEPDVEDGDPIGNLVFSVRVPVGQLSVTVPQDYRDALPADTPVKIEVGGIGEGDNATFTEEDGFCINEDKGCD